MASGQRRWAERPTLFVMRWRRSGTLSTSILSRVRIASWLVSDHDRFSGLALAEVRAQIDEEFLGRAKPRDAFSQSPPFLDQAAFRALGRAGISVDVGIGPEIRPFAQ